MGKYSLIQKLGQGTFGCVWKAMKRPSEEVVAIKKLRDTMHNDWNSKLFKKEAECLRSFNHPNILKLQDTYNEGGHLHMVLEHMETDVFNMISKRLRPFPETKVRRLCYQLLRGVSYMHGQGYCHCDLKPENLLFSKNTVKIADMGHAINMRESIKRGDHLHPYVVSRPYRAPELLLRSSSYDFAIDMWSVGVIMAQLYSVHPIFSDSSEPRNQLYNICSVIGCPTAQTWLNGLKLADSMGFKFPKEFVGIDCRWNLKKLMPNASDEAIDLVRSLCSWDPKQRPTADEALSHPFFSIFNLHANTKCFVGGKNDKSQQSLLASDCLRSCESGKNGKSRKSLLASDCLKSCESRKNGKNRQSLLPSDCSKRSGSGKNGKNRQSLLPSDFLKSGKKCKNRQTLLPSDCLRSCQQQLRMKGFGGILTDCTDCSRPVWRP